MDLDLIHIGVPTEDTASDGPTVVALTAAGLNQRLKLRLARMLTQSALATDGFVLILAAVAADAAVAAVAAVTSVEDAGLKANEGYPTEP